MPPAQRLELDIPPEVPQALADPARVRQIITNLLTNAHLYTPEGGREIRDASFLSDRAYA